MYIKYEINNQIENNDESDQESTATNETNKSELEDSNSIETEKKPEPTTPKYTGEFSYEALEYWANKGH